MNISLKKRTFLILLAGLTATFASAQEQPLPEWQSQYAVGLNKLAPHTYVWPYANASDIEKPGGYEQSPFYMTLNGKWKFEGLLSAFLLYRRLGGHQCSRQLGTSRVWYSYLRQRNV